jgi:four helix bundle protein
MLTGSMQYEKKSYTKKWSGKGKTTVNREPRTVNRGRLAPLMTEETKATASIHELSYDFGCRITRLFQYLTEDAEYKEYVQSKQIYRSATSIGANVRESKHAQSDADFLSKLSIAYKEADETEYWLDLLHETQYLDDKQYTSLNDDCIELIKMLTAAIKKLKE